MLIRVRNEKEIVKKAHVIERGQSSPSADNEKGPRDQEFPLSQVGRSHADRKGDAPATGTPARSGWFDDETKEIGDAASGAQFEFGWVYVRTKTGHRRERTARRNSVP